MFFGFVLCVLTTRKYVHQGHIGWTIDLFATIVHRVHSEVLKCELEEIQFLSKV